MSIRLLARSRPALFWSGGYPDHRREAASPCPTPTCPKTPRPLGKQERSKLLELKKIQYLLTSKHGLLVRLWDDFQASIISTLRQLNIGHACPLLRRTV